jgi:hypothetical protein
MGGGGGEKCGIRMSKVSFVVVFTDDGLNFIFQDLQRSKCFLLLTGDNGKITYEFMTKNF